MSFCRVALSALAIVSVATPVLGQEAGYRQKYSLGGYIRAGKTTPHAFTSHTDSRTLEKAGRSLMDTRGNAAAAEAARAYMKRFRAVNAMLLLDRGRIVFEAYQGPATADNELYSMSIGKSMTSLAVGTALCAGRIGSLDILAGDIVPELRINNYGKSTVRQLLMMSSGAYQPKRAGQPDFGGALGKFPNGVTPYRVSLWPLRLGEITVGEILWGRLWKAIRNTSVHAPGERFIYKSGDTLALSKIVERATGMTLAAWFDETVWRRVRAARTGHWEADRVGSTLAYAGFQASLRDWARIALWVLETRRKKGCLGDYVRAATSKQIPVPQIRGRTGGGYRGYGYQWWLDNPYTPGFWGKGYAGQEMAIHPETGKILIKFSYRASLRSHEEIYALFKTWVEAESG